MVDRPLAHLSKKELKNLRDIPTAHNHLSAIIELDERRVRRSIHWALVVGFFAMVFAGIAAWPVMKEWFQSSPPTPSTFVSQPSQSHLKPTKPIRPPK
jgi:hypothetical protein